MEEQSGSLEGMVRIGLGVIQFWILDFSFNPKLKIILFCNFKCDNSNV
jgi:hypothetical protein